MAFFDKINSIAKNVGDKTGDAIEMAKINARIASERSAMNDIYRQLGEVYYAHRVNGGEGEPAEAAAIYSQLDQRTAAIDEAQKQIVAIKAEGERRAAEAAAAGEVPVGWKLPPRSKRRRACSPAFPCLIPACLRKGRA